MPHDERVLELPSLGPLAQLVEQLTLNQQVQGSIPWRLILQPHQPQSRHQHCEHPSTSALLTQQSAGPPRPTSGCCIRYHPLNARANPRRDDSLLAVECHAGGAMHETDLGLRRCPATSQSAMADRSLALAYAGGDAKHDTPESTRKRRARGNPYL